MIQAAFSKSHILYLHFSSQNLFAIKSRILLAFSGQFPKYLWFILFISNTSRISFCSLRLFCGMVNCHPNFVLSYRPFQCINYVKLNNPTPSFSHFLFDFHIFQIKCTISIQFSESTLSNHFPPTCSVIKIFFFSLIASL